MPQFHVHMQQYVEQTATMTIEAESWEDARDIALHRVALAKWGPGDDAYDAAVYAVDGPGGDRVYER